MACSVCGGPHSTEDCPLRTHTKVATATEAELPRITYGEKLMSRERTQADAESAATTFRSAGYSCRVIPEIDISTRHPTGMWEVWCEKGSEPHPSPAVRGMPEKGIFEKLPLHARRAYSLSAVLPEPRYNIAVDGTWIGEWKEVEGYPWIGKVFFPRNWETKEEAIRHAENLFRRHEFREKVEVVECYGSYPQDRATIWKNGELTYIYEA